ncbi:MAG: nucleotidyltransferase domain-containing protein [Chitinophagales bacterium]|nr:nucleotidyltransferase domain-containing protein [Chitinophagales bacterium]
MAFIREKDKAILADIFAKAGVPIEVWLYGSRVKGGHHEASDIDLVLRTRDLRPIDIDTLMQLQQAITESNIPVLVELRDWARLPDSFHENILRHYEVIFPSV